MKKTFLATLFAIAMPVMAWSQTYVLPINTTTDGLFWDSDYNLKYYVGESASSFPADDQQGLSWKEADYDDSGWTDFNPCPSNHLYDLFYEEGVTHQVFFRRSFELNEVSDGYYYLELELVTQDTYLCIFINNHFIVDNYDWFTHHKYISIPASCLKNGKNVVAIYDHSSYNGYANGTWGFGIFYDTKQYDIYGTSYTDEELEITDVEQLSNAIYADPIEVYPEDEDEFEVQLKLKNAKDAQNYNFDLRLPDRFELNEAALTTDRHDEHTLTFNKSVEEGVWKFVVFSVSGGGIAGNDGPIINLKMRIGDEKTPSAFPVTIKNAVYSTLTERVAMPNVIVPCNLKEYEPGDANYDRIISVADIVCIVNATVGNPTEKYNKKYADANGDGLIDIFDAQLVLNKVLRRNVSTTTAKIKNPNSKE